MNRRSAVFHFADCKNIPFQRDHKQLNKFTTKDADYRKVLNAVSTCIDHSVKQKVSIRKHNESSRFSRLNIGYRTGLLESRMS